MKRNKSNIYNLTIPEKHKLELNFWNNPNNELPEVDSISNIINKISDAEVFVDCLNSITQYHSENGRILELGAGRAWASCIYKKIYPNCEITSTDISEKAIKARDTWERIWNVKIDNAYSCLSYQTKEEDCSVDFIFAFASAHHFLAHKRTLKEISRILKPNASAVYLYDTACSRLFYPLMFRLVNKIRPTVPEDVLILSELKKIASLNNLSCKIHYYPSLRKRKNGQRAYFKLLTLLPFLQRMLPCTVNIVFTKEKAK